MTYSTILFMSDREPTDNLQSVSDQALAWLARLQKGDVSKVEQQRFQDWCGQDPRHQAAFDQADEFWQLLDNPAQNVYARLQNQPSGKAARPRYWLGLAQAACFVLVFGGLITMLPTQIQNWQSDYVTDAGERKVIELADGSRITLNTDSAISVAYSAEQRGITLVRGEAYFEVAPNKNRPFIVHSGVLSARAVGTAFSVAALDGDKKEVAVSEGVVAVTTGEQSQQLAANQHIRWHDSVLETVQSDDSENRLAWRRGQVVFSRQPLADVIQQVNRYRRWPILIANRALAKRVINGVFKTDDPNAVVSALTHTLSAQAVSLPGGVVVIY
jgi:transmembrane sensor